MEWLTPFLSAVVPSLVCGVALAHLNRKQNRKDKAVESRAAARKKESLLALEMNMANAKLAYAVAMAIKRGSPNGEVEEGIEAYTEAKQKYLKFIDEQAMERLSES
jgi:hypothetical protein